MFIQYIKSFLKFFITPIVGKAILQTSADMLTRYAYPERRSSILHPSQRQKPSYRPGSANWHRERQGMRPAPEFIDYSQGGARRTTKNPFHLIDERFHDVLLVAFDVAGPNAQIVHEWLLAQMPKPNAGGYVKSEVTLDSFWLANDERPDSWSSDCDSAVFVSKGNQEEARKVLRFHGLVD